MLEQPGGSIAYRFQARDAHLVLSPGAHEPIPFRLTLDGEPPGPSHGEDVDQDGRGLLRDGRLYQLVRKYDVVREQTLEITFVASGAEAYAFTFGYGVILQDPAVAVHDVRVLAPAEPVVEIRRRGPRPKRGSTMTSSFMSRFWTLVVLIAPP